MTDLLFSLLFSLPLIKKEKEKKTKRERKWKGTEYSHFKLHPYLFQEST